MKVLVVDVGGTHVKILATGQNQSREFPSGPTLTPRQMVAGVKKLAGDWKYDAVSIGYPGRSCTSILRISCQPENQMVYHRFP
jgi:polyphosphate glucokinase